MACTVFYLLLLILLFNNSDNIFFVRINSALKQVQDFFLFDKN